MAIENLFKVEELKERYQKVKQTIADYELIKARLKTEIQTLENSELRREKNICRIQGGTMKKYIISEDVLSAIINYLRGKPYAEVEAGIYELSRLQEYKEKDDN